MVDSYTRYEALMDALAKAGTQAELARICGVSPTAVWKWVQSGKQLPAEYVLSVEQATGVSRHYLRPDIYPPSDWSRVPPMERTQVANHAPRRARSRQKSIAA